VVLGLGRRESSDEDKAVEIKEAVEVVEEGHSTDRTNRSTDYIVAEEVDRSRGVETKKAAVDIKTAAKKDRDNRTEEEVAVVVQEQEVQLRAEKG
jgi:hypothetical protein